MDRSEKAQPPRVEIIATHVIKPSNPTPQVKKYVSVSLLDQFYHAEYINLIFFYKAPCADEGGELPTASLKAGKLKDSLSEVLALYFPFAGRLRENAYIDCNDAGVPYFEAKVNCSLADVLRKPDLSITIQLMQINRDVMKPTSVPLVVQSSFFECGGIGIAISISHKIADEYTLYTFARSWAITASGQKKATIPDFSISSLLPPADSLKNNENQRKGNEADSVVSKRFVLDASSIFSLKAKDSASGSRVQAVSALIWKSVISTDRLISSTTKPKVIAFQTANMRRQVEPPLPDNSMGNFSNIFGKEREYENKIELSDLVQNLKDGITEFLNDYVKELREGDGSLCTFNHMKKIENIFSRNDVEVLDFTSLCGLKLYHVDFGWGKPAWVTIMPPENQNLVFLLNSKEGDGIEAFVNLKSQHMAVFEQDEELLAFARLNPSIP